MFLVRLIYASKVAKNFGPDDIDSILTSARRHNVSEGITGLLCFSPEYFLQCLEGSRSKVNRIYQTIVEDPRHDGIVILDYKEIVKRDFAQWSMAYVPTTAAMKQSVLKHAGNDEFNPFKMSGSSAHAFLQDAINQHAYNSGNGNFKVA